MKAHESCVGRKPHEVKAKLLEDGRLVLRGVASYREFRSRLIETGEWDTAKIGVGGHVREWMTRTVLVLCVSSIHSCVRWRTMSSSGGHCKATERPLGLQLCCLAAGCQPH